MMFSKSRSSFVTRSSMHCGRRSFGELKHEPSCRRANPGDLSSTQDRLTLLWTRHTWRLHLLSDLEMTCSGSEGVILSLLVTKPELSFLLPRALPLSCTQKGYFPQILLLRSKLLPRLIWKVSFFSLSLKEYSLLLVRAAGYFGKKAKPVGIWFTEYGCQTLGGSRARALDCPCTVLFTRASSSLAYWLYNWWLSKPFTALIFLIVPICFCQSRTLKCSVAACFLCSSDLIVQVISIWTAS